MGIQDTEERSGISISHNGPTHATPENCTAIVTSSTLMSTVYIDYMLVPFRNKGKNRTGKAVYVAVRFKSPINLDHFVIEKPGMNSHKP